jgi:ATP-dependent Clp protease ATP-binding subunit ClpB
MSSEIMSLEIERQALKKEKDDISKKRIDEIDESLVTMKEKEADLRSKWESEKMAKTEINKKKEELEQAKFALAQQL